jgi:hypothetical protein
MAILPARGPQGKWWVIGLFNWLDRPASDAIRLHEWIHISNEAIALSFWDGQLMESRAGILDPPEIPAHGSILLAVRPLEDKAQYIGSDLHFSQGAEVAQWKVTRNGLQAHLRLKREAEGNLWLALPGSPKKAAIDGTQIHPVHIQKIFGSSRCGLRARACWIFAGDSSQEGTGKVAIYHCFARLTGARPGLRSIPPKNTRAGGYSHFPRSARAGARINSQGHLPCFSVSC